MQGIDLGKLQLLSRIPSITLFEDGMLRYLKQYLRAPKHRRLLLGGALAFVPRTRGNGLVLTVHTDRLGLVRCGRSVTYSNYYGYEQCGKEYAPNLAFGQRFVGEEIVAFEPHGKAILAEGRVTGCRIRNAKLGFLVEGIDWSELPSVVPLAYKGGITRTGDFVEGQLDNVLSLAVACQVLRDGLGFCVLFTREEEIGESWRYVAEFLNDAAGHVPVTLDTTSVEGLCLLDEIDVVFRVSDDIARFRKDLIDVFLEVARREGVRTYLKKRSRQVSKVKTITEIGRLTKETKRRHTGATIQFPTTGYHTNREKASVTAASRVLGLLRALDSSREDMRRILHD